QAHDLSESQVGNSRVASVVWRDRQNLVPSLRERENHRHVRGVTGEGPDIRVSRVEDLPGDLFGQRLELVEVLGPPVEMIRGVIPVPQVRGEDVPRERAAPVLGRYQVDAFAQPPVLMLLYRSF